MGTFYDLKIARKKIRRKITPLRSVHKRKKIPYDKTEMLHQNSTNYYKILYNYNIIYLCTVGLLALPVTSKDRKI
jgi:hypothetical protein